MPSAVFEEMLRAARALLAMRHPLDAELAFSEMLGSWWGQRLPGMDVERLLGEGLVAHATASGTPAGLGLLAAVTALGTSRSQRYLAEQGMLALKTQGLAMPEWASQLGAVRPVAAYVSGGRFGDADEVICTFGRIPGSDGRASSGEEVEHALIVVVDHNCGGVLRDAWVTTKVDQLLDHCQGEAADDPMAVFEQIGLEQARFRLTEALDRTDGVLAAARSEPSYDHPEPLTGVTVADLTGGTLAAHYALAVSRVRALPGAGLRPGRPVWRRDRRAVLAARFLASDEAAELSDSYAASRCTDHIIAYGCDVDAGRPLRVSPRKVETFLLHWLPGRVVLLPEEQEAMPHVLAAWIRWAGPKTGLPDVAIGATLDAVWESTAAFTRTYTDPAGSLGLRREAIRRLLPDGDFAALPRRMFAFPLLTSELVTWAPGEFDPATAAGRRALLRLDHFGEYEAATPHQGRHSTGQDRWYRPVTCDDPERERALDRHERLAERLWHGRPANLWAAARRLLDRGMDRPAVLAALQEVVERSQGESDLRRRLDAL